MAGKGKAIGSILGAMAGTAIAPGIGTSVGSSIGGSLGGMTEGGVPSAPAQPATGGGLDGKTALSLGAGIFQQLQAMKLKQKANASMPPLVDPNQSAYLAELAQKRKSLETGADFAAGMDAVDSTMAGTQEAITRSTGGDVGGTIQGLLQSQRAATDAKNQVLSQGQQQQANYNQLYGNLLNSISARRMQLQLAKSQQARAEWAKKQQTANQNIMAGLGNLLGSDAPQQPGVNQPPSTGAFDIEKLKSDVGSINASPIDNASFDAGTVA